MTEEILNLMKYANLTEEKAREALQLVPLAHCDTVKFYAETDRFPTADEIKIIQLFGYSAWHNLYHMRIVDIDKLQKR